MLDLAVIVLSYSTKSYTLGALQSVIDYPPKNSYKLIVVDNASTDGSSEMVTKDFPRVTLIKSPKNLGFTGGNNLGLKSIDANFYLLLNSDTQVKPDALTNLLKFAKSHPDFGIISAKLLNPNQTFQPSGGDLPSPLPLFNWLSGLDDILSLLSIKIPTFHYRDESSYETGKPLGWIGGTAMLISRQVVEKIGLLDEKIFMYAEDVDYCWRANRSGFKIGWVATARIVHFGGVSTNTPHLTQWRGEFRGLLYLYQKNYGQLAKLILRLGIYFFATLRLLAFTLFGKFEYAKTYARILKSL